jgi:hypothetical protein
MDWYRELGARMGLCDILPPVNDSPPQLSTLSSIPCRGRYVPWRYVQPQCCWRNRLVRPLVSPPLVFSSGREFGCCSGCEGCVGGDGQPLRAGSSPERRPASTRRDTGSTIWDPAKGDSDQDKPCSAATYQVYRRSVSRRSSSSQTRLRGSGREGTAPTVSCVGPGPDGASARPPSHHLREPAATCSAQRELPVRLRTGPARPVPRQRRGHRRWPVPVLGRRALLLPRRA